MSVPPSVTSKPSTEVSVENTDVSSSAANNASSNDVSSNAHEESTCSLLMIAIERSEQAIMGAESVLEDDEVSSYFNFKFNKMC